MKFENKGDLVNAIVRKTGLTKKDAGVALDAFVGSITDALREHKGVRLVGFGSFKVSHRKARNGRNPQTGRSIKIAAHDIPTFKAGMPLKKDVNK